MMAALRVFISHASVDNAFAERLAADLRNAGADVWLDSTHLTGPGDFVARISRALNERDVLVLVLSPAAIASQWVPDEMNAAIVRAKQGYMHPPLVVQYGNVSTRDIPGLWTTYQRINATNDYYAALNRALGALGLRQPASPPPLPSPATVVGTPVPRSVPSRGAPPLVSPKTTSQKPTIPNSWLRNGLVFGIIFAVSIAPLSFFPFASPTYFLPLPFNMVVIVMGVVTSYFAGFRATVASGKLRDGALAGLCSGVFGIVMAVILSYLIDWLTRPVTLQFDLTTVAILHDLLLAAITGCIGPGIGALGGAVGRRRTKR